MSDEIGIDRITRLYTPDSPLRPGSIQLRDDRLTLKVPLHDRRLLILHVGESSLRALGKLIQRNMETNDEYHGYEKGGGGY